MFFKTLLFSLCCLVNFSLATLAAEPSATPAVSATTTDKADDFSVLPVGLNVGNNNILPSLLVRGKEDGSQAVNFHNWLVPYDTVLQALKFTTKVLPDGQVELRSQFIVTRFDPNKLRNDPELGAAISIQELENLLGIKAEFNITEYAISLTLPTVKTSGQATAEEVPIVLEGLPRVKAPNLTLAAIEERTSAAGADINTLKYQGDLGLVGSLLGNSWFVGLQQPDLTQQTTWKLSEAQILRQSGAADYMLGSQPVFWRSQSQGDYWGVTTIQRQGFTPPKPTGGAASPDARLQAYEIGRTITGTTAPGTLVKLTKGGIGGSVLAEVLVDSSGIYRFENIPFGGSSNSYRLLLYPRGQLTAQPEIRDAVFTNLPGQIPKGSSALIVSGGWRRQQVNQNLLGEFTNFTGGIAQRWGLAENLTVGLGGVYDESVKGLAEIFFQPKGFPLRTSVSALLGSTLDMNTDIQFQPSPKFNMFFRSDRLSSQFNVNWRVFSLLGLSLTSDSQQGLNLGLQLSLPIKKGYAFGSITHNEKSGWNWNFYQGLGKLQFSHIGNDTSTSTKLSYNFNDNRSLSLNYDTTLSQSTTDNFLTLLFHYRSAAKAIDGNLQWEAELGYGMGSRGSGFLVTVGTTILPGLLLRVRYQEISLTSDQSSFSLEFVPSLNFQRGIRPGDRRAGDLRSMGGLLIQPFFDANNNGKLDAGEQVYTDLDMLILNNRPIKSYHVERLGDRLLVHLPPDTYRLDFDPAGFPIDWRTNVDALAVEVVAGSYTPVLIPLNRSYIVSGVVSNAEGKPIGGARVEAISATSEKVFSITNGAGVYYLEGLKQGTYTLNINGKPANPAKITIHAKSESLQELNLKQ